MDPTESHLGPNDILPPERRQALLDNFYLQDFSDIPSLAAGLEALKREGITEVKNALHKEAKNYPIDDLIAMVQLFSLKRYQSVEPELKPKFLARITRTLNLREKVKKIAELQEEKTEPR